MHRNDGKVPQVPQECDACGRSTDVKEIRKYELQPIDGVQVITMPEGAKILNLQVQRGDWYDHWFPVIWAFVDPKAAPVLRTLRIFRTGELIQSTMNELLYIGTYRIPNDKYESDQPQPFTVRSFHHTSTCGTCSR